MVILYVLNNEHRTTLVRFMIFIVMPYNIPILVLMTIYLVYMAQLNSFFQIQRTLIIKLKLIIRELLAVPYEYYFGGEDSEKYLKSSNEVFVFSIDEIKQMVQDKMDLDGIGNDFAKRKKLTVKLLKRLVNVYKL